MENKFNETFDASYGHNSVPESKFSKYLTLSILEFFFCFNVTGILGIIFSCLANSEYNNGNYVKYESYIANAKTSLIVGLIIGIIIYLLLFCYLGFSLSLMNSLC